MKLNELPLTSDGTADEIPADLPEIGTYTPALYPGDYEMRLPASLPECWEVFDLEMEDGSTEQHISLRFDNDHPLVVIGGPHDGETLSYQTFTDVARPRGKDKVMVSDLAYLLRDGLGDKTPIKGKTRSEVQKALIALVNKGAGKIVSTTVQWTSSCRDDKPARFKMEDGSIQPDETTFGCGARYYQDYRGSKEGSFALPKGEDGKFLENFECTQCGAQLRCFAQIGKFRRKK